MLNTIPRKNPEINDGIEALNDCLLRVNGDLEKAWESLSSDEMEFVESEISKCLDRDYFLQNYYVIRTEHGETRTLFPYWDHQSILAEAIDEENSSGEQCLIIVLKPRQAGITVWVSASMFHRTIFTPNTYTLTVAQNGDTSTAIFKMMNNAYQALPWWLRPEKLYKQEGSYLEFQTADEVRRMTNPGLNSVIQVDNAQKMTGVAIGRTYRCVHLSEVSRWPNADMFTADIEPSMNAKDEYGIMESTAFGREGLYYDHWAASLDGDTGWRPVFIPVYKIRKYIDLGRGFMNKKHQTSLTLTLEEQSFTDRVRREEKYEIPQEFWAFRRQKLKASIRTTGAPWSHMESYPITPDEAFQASGICAFDRSSLIEQRTANICNPLWVGEIVLVNHQNGSVNTDKLRLVADGEVLPRRKGGLKEDKIFLRKDRLWVWEWPEDNETYYVAVDSALGVPDGDYSVIEVFRLGLGGAPDEQVAEWWGHCPPHELARTAAALGFWYKGNGSATEVAVEYQGPGITTGDKIRDELDYPNLYRPKYKDRVSAQYTPHFHWVTSSKTRDLIITEMNEALLSHSVVIHSETLIDEMLDFGTMDTGSGSMSVRYKGQGNHDDGVMAAQICLYCLRETNSQVRMVSSESQRELGNPGELHVYGVFDNLNRQRGQYYDKKVAEQVIVGMKGWKVNPVLICKANTLYSPIYHASGAEHDLRFKFGLRSEQILPDVISAYRRSMSIPANDDDAYGGEEW
jgi:hypothetical protein